MSLPKEPRQKMINMMYLVLTALLALNVSSEVLNAFKTVDNSITNANGVLTGNSNQIYASFTEKLSDPKSAEMAKLWKPKADAASQLSKKLFDDIEGLKMQIRVAAGYHPETGDTMWAIDHLDAPTRIMSKQGEGEKLYAKLADYKKQILAIDPAIAAEFANKLPIDLSVPKAQDGTTKSWTESYFHMTPAIAAITILNKFQNDIKNSEYQVVSYCHNQVGQVAVRFDKFGFVGGLSSSYLMPGEKIQVYAGLGAMSSASAPQITINGRPAPIGADGMATMDMAAGGTGSGKAHVVVRYKDQDGIDKVIEKDLNYTVGAPSGVSVSADKMNVLYLGVENPMTITAGVGSEKVSATLDGPGKISRVGGPKWVVVPSGNPRESAINVIIDGKATAVKYRIKSLPPPASFVGAKRGGAIPAGDFKAMGGVIARLLDSEFEAPFKVVSYQVGALGGKYPVYQFANQEGNRWSGNAKTIIDGATPGTSIFFDQIKVVGPDGRTVDLPMMTFNLK
ncbi:MAG: gliding motility protein GldM [Chitinophagaceae bacterium]|nr:MAG: gliding motility protein GldM [Chitinophagaceae bacterium]